MWEPDYWGVDEQKKGSRKRESPSTIKASLLV
jgi:hypothetical protein